MKKILNEEFHLPHGTKSVKLVTHVDLDGLVSGISTVQQLIKQGIPKDRIVIEFAQYGDEKKDKNFNDRFNPNNKNQKVFVTDFAKLQKVSPFSILDKLTDFKAKDYKQELINLLKKDVSKMNLKEFSNYIKNTFKIVENKFTEGNVESLYKACLAYKNLEKNKKAPNITVQNIDRIEYQSALPYFESDHHSNDTNSLSPGLRGDLAASSPSEAELIADKYAPGLWSKEDIEAVSMVDSAGYTEEQLKNTIFLEKNFTGKNKKKNLAIIICTVYDNLAKKDRNAAKWIIKNAGPSLVSVYNTTLKAARFNKDRIEYLNALKDGNVEKAKELLKSIPGELNKQYDRKGEPTKPVMSTDEYREKNLKDLENAKTGHVSKKEKAELEDLKKKKAELNAQKKEEKDKEKKKELTEKAKTIEGQYKELKTKLSTKKGKIFQYNNFTFFDGKDKKTQYSRYMTSLSSNSEGQRTPFTLRYWDGFFQVAKNTLYKGEVNFFDIQGRVLIDIVSFLTSKGFNRMKISSIIENMKKENGGHKFGIWSFTGFDKIKPSSKEYGDYWDKKEIVDKAKKLNMMDKVPNAKKVVDEKTIIIDKYSEIKKECMEYAMSSVVKWTNKLYPPKQEDLDALKTNDKTFEINS